MLFNDRGSTRPPAVLAISQPAHALVSGQILRAWAEPLPEAVLLAAEQHDIAWMDWEVSPTFDPATGRPHDFRSVGAATHAPMWERGVALARAAWGRRVALLVSRHGSTIYERYAGRHKAADGGAKAADDAAAQDYLRRHKLMRQDWARALDLDAGTIARDGDLVALSDTLSLVLCGALPAPLQIDVAGQTMVLAADPGAPDSYTLDPWPFGSDEVTVETEARAMPVSGRFADEAAMRAWLETTPDVTARACLRRLS